MASTSADAGAATSGNGSCTPYQRGSGHAVPRFVEEEGFGLEAEGGGYPFPGGKRRRGGGSWYWDEDRRYFHGGTRERPLALGSFEDEERWREPESEAREEWRGEGWPSRLRCSSACRA